MHRVEHVMGTPIVVTVRDGDDHSAVDEVLDWFRHVDATFSTYKAESEISRIRR
jgi:FAD:protein FMN transferase